MATARILGPGRAGLSLLGALQQIGWNVQLVGRCDPIEDAAAGVDALFLTTPDGVIADVAASVRPNPTTVVLHLSGSMGPDVLAPHPRRAALHPLIPLPTPAVGVQRLLGGITFAVAGDPLAARIAEALGGRVVAVADEDRETYHAAACIAANHVVALLGQVERVAASVNLDLAAFLPLARAAVDDVGHLGPATALTGPAARGDLSTIDHHLAALDESERSGYAGGVALALRLAADRPSTEAADRPSTEAADRPSTEAAQRVSFDGVATGASR